ncbi:MAG: hypothetical protein RRY72_06825 [Bacteroides sp.]
MNRNNPARRCRNKPLFLFAPADFIVLSLPAYKVLLEKNEDRIIKESFTVRFTVKPAANRRFTVSSSKKRRE